MPTTPRIASETPRQGLRRHLVDAPHTAHELSALVGLPEKDVVPHLEHLARSVHGARERLAVEPARCLRCGFVFRERTRLGKPSGCPRCRAPHVAAPVFRIVRDENARRR